MTDPARKPDPDLSPEKIADAMEAAGLSPRLATLMHVFKEFQELKRKAAEASAVEPAEVKWPLMKLVPVGVRYERARRAAEAGHLEAKQLGDSNRWICTEAAMKRWLAMIGHSKGE